MKRISVIVPVYNAEKNISICLDSVVEQLTNDDELLLINDGSKDGSIAILKQYEQKYSFVRVIDKENEGVATTRNKGIELANGKYILFIDNDDFIDEDYVEKYYQEIENNNYDCVIGGYKRVSEEGIKFQVKPLPSDWYKLMVVAPWAKIYRAEFLKKNNIRFLDYSIGEDSYFSISLYNSTNNIGFIDYVGYNWWFNESSVSNTSQRGFNPEIDLLFLLEKLYEITGSAGIYQFYYVRYVVWYLLFSGRSATKGDFLKEYNRLIEWLRQKKIKVKFPLFDKRLVAEPNKNRYVIKTMVIIHKMHLMKIFARLYCKG